jgi:predicted nucleotidyltransferase
MQLRRGEPVAGVDPDIARTLARLCQRDWTSDSWLAGRTGFPLHAVVEAMGALEAAGYFERQDGLDGAKWITTISGNALAMASFAKPIARSKVDALLEGVLQRVREYNADGSKPFVVTEISVFGSYLDRDADKLGDLDLGLKFAARSEQSASTDALLDFARASGKQFSTIVDRFGWAQKDLLQTLRNRSGYINLHTEDLSRFTDRWEVVFSDAAPEGSNL